MDEVDRNVPGSHLIRQPTAATFPSRGRLDTQQIVHSCDFVQSHKFPFVSEIFYETDVHEGYAAISAEGKMDKIFCICNKNIFETYEYVNETKFF